MSSFVLFSILRNLFYLICALAQAPFHQWDFALWFAKVFPALLFAALEELLDARVFPALPTLPP